MDPYSSELSDDDSSGARCGDRSLSSSMKSGLTDLEAGDEEDEEAGADAGEDGLGVDLRVGDLKDADRS